MEMPIINFAVKLIQGSRLHGVELKRLEEIPWMYAMQNFSLSCEDFQFVLAIQIIMAHAEWVSQIREEEWRERRMELEKNKVKEEINSKENRGKKGPVTWTCSTYQKFMDI